jgi:hypothetical protein
MDEPRQKPYTMPNPKTANRAHSCVSPADNRLVRDLRSACTSFMSSLCAGAYCECMNRDRIISTSGGDRGTRFEAERDTVTGFRGDSQLQVAVISTTSKGTLAALRTAARLANNLDARITLAIIKVVRRHLSLDVPPLLIEFIEKRAFALVSDAGIKDREISIQIWICHDRKKCLRQALGSKTLVVVGGTKHWWRRDEQKLEEWLCREGYPTIFSDADAKNITGILSRSHREAILHRVVKKSDNTIAFPEGN